MILLPLTVQRFHSTRKMVRDHGGSVLPMMLQLGMRTREAQVAWGHFHRICHIGLRRTVVMGMRGEKMGASEDDRRAVRALKLTNTSNHCYSHAALLALLCAIGSLSCFA